MLAGHGPALLEAALPAWLPRQRWFGAKTRKIQSVHVADWVELPAGEPADIPGVSIPSALFFIKIAYADGPSDTYQIPLAFRTINRGHLLGALIPLYLAWVASHINITASGTNPERHIEAVAAAFEADKPYLVSRWRWPDRFNP
jgi:hypothetical protein